MIMQDKLIQKYLSGELKGDELLKFYHKAANDTKFAQQISSLETINKGAEDLRHESENELIINQRKKELSSKQALYFAYKQKRDPNFRKKAEIYNALNNSFDHKTKDSKNIIKKYSLRISAAAAIIVILFIGRFYLQTSLNNDSEQQIANIAAEETKENKTETIIKTEKKKAEIKTTKEVKAETLIAEKNKNKGKKSEIEKLIEDYKNNLKNDEDVNLLAYAENAGIELPENFKENSLLTNIALSNLRSDNAEIISPQKMETVKIPFNIKWNKATEITIKIKDNNKNIVWEKQSKKIKTIVCDKKITQGTYYLIINYKKENKEKQMIRQFFIIK